MIRQVIVVRRDDFAAALHDDSTTATKESADEGLLAKTEQLLRKLLGGYKGYLSVIGVPSQHWQVRLTQETPRELTPPGRLVISIAFPDAESLSQFRKLTEEANKIARDQGKSEPVLGLGADLSLAESGYFCPTNVDEILFGDRNAAALLTESGVLAQQGLTGSGVNVVVLDQGFDATKVRNFGGGLANGTVQPGTTKRGHGLMLVRNIAAIAPDATFYDVPLLPNRISDLPGFISTALHVLDQLKHLIECLRQTSVPLWSGPWVLVNAWSIFDRSAEFPRGDYTENPDHPLNRLVEATVDDGVDIVFAAGNCGQFCPDRRCGKLDVGPGYSIFGANSHPRVLTVGAVRTDTRWMGNSSQGPGQHLLSRWKPDLCAPSYFREAGDAFVGNLNEPFVGNTGSPYMSSTGTSAACALAAGIVAAIRSGWDQTILAPDDLKRALNAGARKTEGPGWNERLGNGIIDVKATLPALRAFRRDGKQAVGVKRGRRAADC
jgi:subtilisin family serine protease